MGSLCFSSASILRCEPFTSLESKILIIPTALELIFSSTLIFTNWGTGWRHLLLTAEGWSYFALALLELLSHNIPAVRDSVSVFSIVDIVLGATSFLPIFFYTLFVYLFTRRELTDTLPKRFQNISNVLLLGFIPAIVALNEISSFVGISRRTVNVGGKEVVEIGFPTFNDQQLWTFLTSVTLAVLTAFQAINFCFAFYRLIRAFIDQRRIETTSSDQAHLIRGIGWISGALKLGAIETVIGFASQGGFGGAITRRSLRFIARAFLVIGVVKGVDRLDDFTEVTKELSSAADRAHFRRSRLANLISNPRFSTFRQLSPTANEFYEAPRAPTTTANDAAALRRQSTLRRQSAGPVPQMAEFSQLRREATLTRSASTPMTPESGIARPRQRERVTVHYGGGAPTLEMRFSGLDMPSPAVIAESVKARPVSSSWVSIARSSRYAPSTTAPSFAFDAPPVPMTYPEFIYDRGTLPRESEPVDHRRGLSEFSGRSSTYPDSLNAVRELASQFPHPGDLPTPIPERSEWHDDPESQRNSRRSWDLMRPSRDSAYAGSMRTPPRRNHTLPAATQQSPDHAPLRYAYGGMEYPESPEPLYRYNYDGADDALHPHMYSPPVVNPDSPTVSSRHRNVNSGTSFGNGNTPMAYLSPFAQDTVESTSTPGTDGEYSSNPFEYDEVPRDVGKGKQRAYSDYRTSTQGVPQPVFMGDGPHNDKGIMAGPERSSAVLLQMMQREDVDWTPAEFTPSMLEAPSRTPSTSTTASRHTLKKRRPSGKSEKRPPVGVPTGASAETFASSWLHGDMDADADVDTSADDEHRYVIPASMPARVKSVGRVRAPRKATPAPINARHGMTRGSVYIQPIHVPPSEFHSEVQIVQGASSAESTQSEFAMRLP